VTVTLTVGGRRHEGWTAASVVRSLETVAGAFRLGLTERAPGEAAPRPVRPGDPCAVTLDGNPVVRGYIDAVRVGYDADGHGLDVAGRDAAGDLVDCSAAAEPGEWHNERLEAIAAALAGPFGIPVRAEADTGEPFRRFRIEEGETVFEAIERACRFRRLLPLSDGAGGLALGRPARSRAEGRLVRGDNILAAAGETGWIDRYSDYTLRGQQPGSDFLGAERAAHVAARARDPGVTRHRPLTLVGEQALDAAEAQERIEWEATVRASRARRASVTVQGWRETPNGPLWAPGRLVRVTDDWLGLDRELLVVSTEQSIDDGGTLTRMTLMPEDAFSPAPAEAPAATQERTGWWG